MNESPSSLTLPASLMENGNGLVRDLIRDYSLNRQVIIPDSDLSQAVALKSLLLELAETAGQDPSPDSIRTFLAAWLELDVDDPLLESVHIVTSGIHSFDGGFVIAAGNSVVSLTGVGAVIAVNTSRVIARDRVSVFGCDHTRLNLYDSTVASLSGNAFVNSYDYSTGQAVGFVTGRAYNRSNWRLFGAARFDTHDHVIARCREDSSVRGYGSSRTYGRDKVTAQLFDGSCGWFADASEIELHGESTVYTQDLTRARKISGCSQLLSLADVSVVLV